MSVTPTAADTPTAQGAPTAEGARAAEGIGTGAASGRERPERQVVQGVVRSSAMDKTIVVEVRDRVMHPGYKKYITRRRRFMAHDETNRCQVGDVVRIVSSRPLSRRKTWRLLELVERPS